MGLLSDLFGSQNPGDFGTQDSITELEDELDAFTASASKACTSLAEEIHNKTSELLNTITITDYDSIGKAYDNLVDYLEYSDTEGAFYPR